MDVVYMVLNKIILLCLEKAKSQREVAKNISKLHATVETLTVANLSSPTANNVGCWKIYSMHRSMRLDDSGASADK